MSKLTDKIESELAPVDGEELFDQCLDEGDPVRIGSLEYTPSHVLKQIDPTAYRCGVNDYVDSLGLKEINGNNYDPDKVDKICEELVEELESAISDLDSSLDERSEKIKELEDVDASEFTKDQIKETQAEIDSIKEAATEIENEIEQNQEELRELREEIKSL